MMHVLARSPAALLLFCVLAAGEEGACPPGYEDQAPHGDAASASDSDQVSLMQIGLRAARQGSSARGFPSNILNNLPSSVLAGATSDAANGKMVESLDAGMCEELHNNVAYFTVEVGIGTPEQKFHLVADTGSDAVIIPDCKCVQSGYCASLKQCFTAEKSKSFGLDIKKTEDDSKLAIMGAKMNYGSGQIQVVVASERVRVAHVKTTMHNGVFLMEDRRSLQVHGEFQGILGLGLPHDSPLTKSSINIPAFMEKSKSTKYALCFNEDKKPGALRVGLQALPNPMTNMGEVHWGLDLQGISVGKANIPALFCTPDSKKEGMKSACGAIPDSGTTLLMGPPAQVKQIFEGVCDEWPRCREAVKKGKSDKSTAFQELLYGCESWLDEEGGKGIGEIPSIFIHMAGAEGKPQSVELPPWAFVLKTTQEVYKVINAKVMGVLPLTAAVDTGKKKKICAASFGAQNYTTSKNGPVWIMGAPLFYANSVAYDIGTKDTKPQIGFEKGPCRMCNETASTASLVSSGSVTEEVSPNALIRQRQRPLRHIDALRETSIDTTKTFF